MEQKMETESQLPSVKDLVKDSIVKFSHYRAENFYYNLEHSGKDPDLFEYSTENEYTPNYRYNLYQFPVDIDDIGNGTLLAVDKAITFMRWIRQARENGTLIKL